MTFCRERLTVVGKTQEEKHMKDVHTPYDKEVCYDMKYLGKRGPKIQKKLRHDGDDRGIRGSLNKVGTVKERQLRMEQPSSNPVVNVQIDRQRTRQETSKKLESREYRY